MKENLFDQQSPEKKNPNLHPVGELHYGVAFLGFPLQIGIFGVFRVFYPRI
jgi:hypothetical protein